MKLSPQDLDALQNWRLDQDPLDMAFGYSTLLASSTWTEPTIDQLPEHKRTGTPRRVNRRHGAMLGLDDLERLLSS